MENATWTIGPCSEAAVRALVDALGVSATTASVLVRRGHDDPADGAGVPRGRAARARPVRCSATCARRSSGSAPRSRRAQRICVHGDYDADGICATSLAVLLLRELGAEPEWHLPSRFEEGYGLASQTIARLAADGVELVLTVDCGITAVAEVDEARRLGLEVVVTDHHRPGDTFPACPVVAPLKGAYPFAGLCGTGVVWKLAEALLGPGHPFLERHLDVVALATVADVVPLVDENRALARLGLRRLAQTQKPGLLALMRVAGVDPAACEESAIGFRLAPRINAAGRLGRPEAALELLLTDDPAEATRLAEDLEVLNRERQGVEERILRAAIAEIESWPEARRRHRGYVVAGEDWHEGVIGIVASRLVERYGRPVVLIAGADGNWKGSGRSTTAFDLHGALAACAEHLERFGGHRAAAGLTIRPEQRRAVRRRVRRARRRGADATPTCGRGSRSTRSSPARELGLPLCEELGALAPFGLGNPGVTLLVDGCELDGALDGRRRQAPALPRQPARPRRGRRDRVRRRRPARPPPPAGPLRRRVPPPGEPLERHGLAAARRAPRVRRERALRGAAPAGSPSEWARARRRGARTRARSSRSSSSSATARGGGACSSRTRSGGCSTSRRRSPRPPDAPVAGTTARAARLPAAEDGAAACCAGAARAGSGSRPGRARAARGRRGGAFSSVGGDGTWGSEIPCGTGVSCPLSALLAGG